jgi:hypothetical protein
LDSYKHCPAGYPASLHSLGLGNISITVEVERTKKWTEKRFLEKLVNTQFWTYLCSWRAEKRVVCMVLAQEKDKI